MKSRHVDGPKLAAARESRGYNIRNLAARVGCRPQWISEIENGHGQPGERLYAAFLDVLDVDPGDISAPRDGSEEEMADVA